MDQGSLAQPKLSSAVLTGHSIKTTHSCWFYASWQHTGLEYRLQHSEEGNTRVEAAVEAQLLSQHQPRPGVPQAGVCWESRFPPQPLLQRGGCGKSYIFPLRKYHTRIAHVIPIGPCFSPGRCHQQTQCGECGLSKQVTVPCLCMCTLQKSAERWPDQIKCVAISQLQ